MVGIENRFRSRDLNAAQRFPAVRIDKLTNKLGKAVKNFTHFCFCRGKLLKKVPSALPSKLLQRIFTEVSVSSPSYQEEQEQIHLPLKHTSFQSHRSLQAAQKQLSGELGKRIAEFSDRLMDMTALVEAYIDFPEDDLPDEDKQALFKSADELASDFSRLIETSKYTHLVHNGINAVIAGAPNAGKSSLLNRLVGDERAIVSSSAGTTRDFISEKIILGKYSLNIVDTAGLRTPDGEIEARGIGMAIDKLKLSDIRLLVFDSADEPPELPEEVIATLSPDNTIAIINKCDLPNAKISLFKEKFKDFNPVEISCEKSQGIENLRNAIINLIETKHITASADDILVSARHASALERAKDALKSASIKIEANEASELPASDLREALNALGEIVGKTDHEQILDRIFSKFCIGK